MASCHFSNFERTLLSRYTFRVAAIARFLYLCALIGFQLQPARAQNSPGSQCPRPAVGSAAVEPADLRSENGELHVHFSYYSSPGPNGSTRYCYVAQNGAESPTLRVHPGDWLTINLKNEMTAAPSGSAAPNHMEMSKSCAGGGAMIASATNLHFHGLAIPPTCHQDEVL